MDVAALTAERYDRRVERTKSNFGLGHTEEGLSVATQFLEEYTMVVARMLPLLKPKAIRETVEKLDHKVIALVAISSAFDTIANEEVYLSAYYSSAGQALDFERYGLALKASAAGDVVQSAMQRGSLKARQRSVRAFAKEKGFNLELWTNSIRIKVGGWLHSIAINGPAFMDEGGLPRLTPEARSIVADVVQISLETNPVRIPSKKPIPLWIGPEKAVDGYPLNLVRGHRKAGKRVIAAAFKDRSILPTVESVNYIESVPYRVQQSIADLVEWTYEKGIPLKKFPQRDDYPIPEKVAAWEQMTEAQQKQWKKDASLVKRKNNGLDGQRNMLVFLLQTARWLGQDEFYLPASLDFRGRVYAMTQFNFHSFKFVRAMFRFAHGKPLGERGLFWLKVHTANSFGVDKVPFEERVAWVDSHMELIQSTAADPYSELSWTEADDPFMFVSACMELDDALSRDDPTSFVSTLPVSFDGSCNGLQHFAAVTRDPFTAYHVNLVPRVKPGDIYGVVAEEMKETARKSSEPIARVCFPHINRSLVKRNVMTFGYSSPRGGMVNQHREDTMEPEQDKVRRNPAHKHKFGDDGGEAAAQYLGTLGYNTITGLLQKPAEAMKFLRQVASKLSDQAKPVIWHTPLGFPVVQSCTEFKTECTSLFLHDKGVRRRVWPREGIETNTINKNDAKKGIAPNFIHSMDACHLHSVVLACKDEGITDLALVHDSYGCLAADADDLRRILKEQFYILYAEHNVLTDFLRETCEQMDSNWHELPNAPDLGDYDITDILNAEYAFA